MTDNNIDIDPPPIFKSWKRFYWTVAGNLVLLLILFYIFTRMFE